MEDTKNSKFLQRLSCPLEHIPELVGRVYDKHIPPSQPFEITGIKESVGAAWKKRTVNILGTEYTIKPRELKNEDIDGFCDDTQKLIVIRSDNENEVGDFEYLQKKQLRHEIIHAFMSESGLQSNWQHTEQFGHDETTVDWFAIQSPKIFKVFQELDIL